MPSSGPTSPNPYLLAGVTALLSGAFAIAGVLLASHLSGNQARDSSYRDFLESGVEKTQTGEIVAKLLFAVKLAEVSGTDGEIQQVEDAVSAVSGSLDQEFVTKLNATLSALHAQATPEVRTRIDDLVLALTHRHREIHLRNYPYDFQSFFVWMSPELDQIRPEDVSSEVRPLLAWMKSVKRSEVDYFEEKVSDQERFRVLLAGKLYQEMLDQMNRDLNQ